MKPEETLAVGQQITPKLPEYPSPVLYIQRFERFEDRTLVALGPDHPDSWRHRSAFDETGIETTRLVPLAVLLDAWKNPEDPTVRYEVCRCGHDDGDHTGMGVGCLNCESCTQFVLDHVDDRVPQPATSHA